MSVARETLGLLATVLKAFSCIIAGRSSSCTECCKMDRTSFYFLQDMETIAVHWAAHQSRIIKPGSEWELTEVEGKRSLHDYQSPSLLNLCICLRKLRHLYFKLIGNKQRKEWFVSHVLQSLVKNENKLWCWFCLWETAKPQPCRCFVKKYWIN